MIGGEGKNNVNDALHVQVLRPISGVARSYVPGEVHPATEFRNHTSLAKLGKLRYCDTPTGHARVQPIGAPALEASIARYAPSTTAAAAPAAVKDEAPSTDAVLRSARRSAGK